MAKAAGKPKPAKLTREQKKLERATKKARRKETFASIKQAFALTRQNDPKLLLFMVGVGVGVAVVSYLLLLWLFGPWIPIFFALMFGIFAAMIMFSRRASKAMYTQAEGQPGAAVWLLQNQLRGDWRTTPAIAGTSQLDAVHRVVGRPGVILVGEGAPHRVKGLMAQEKKKVSRVAPDTPIYDFLVGTNEGDTRLKDLNKLLLKLPRNLSKEQVDALEKRLQALSMTRPPLPQGPLPSQAKMRNIQRTARRRSG